MSGLMKLQENEQASKQPKTNTWKSAQAVDQLSGCRVTLAKCSEDGLAPML